MSCSRATSSPAYWKCSLESVSVLTTSYVCKNCGCTLATFRSSFTWLFGHCISHQLMGTIWPPVEHKKNTNHIFGVSLMLIPAAMHWPLWWSTVGDRVRYPEPRGRTELFSTTVWNSAKVPAIICLPFIERHREILIVHQQSRLKDRSSGWRPIW